MHLTMHHPSLPVHLRPLEELMELVNVTTANAKKTGGYRLGSQNSIVLQQVCLDAPSLSC